MCEAALIASNIVNEILKVESIEEAFSCFLVHRAENEAATLSGYEQELSNALSQMPADQQEIAVQQYLNMTATMSNHSRLKLLMGLLERLVQGGIISPRMVCECIMSSEKLIYKNQEFWVECFNFVNKIIVGVDYKGVREIMKSCTEKARSLPNQLMSSTYPQMKALMSVAEHIVDREASLLPGYLLVNELQKVYPDSNLYPHWQLAHLFSDYIESFRPCAQMVSVVGHEQMRPIIEPSGCPEHLYNPFKLDPSTLKFTLKGTLPYAPELVEKQTGLLRYVLEQPYSREVVCRMLGLPRGSHKLHCAALDEQLVELLVLAMERSEIDDNAAQPLWLHLCSQLINFVLQYASFQNIVEALCIRLAGRDLRKGRDHLVWVLLQFISGSIQRNPLSNFLPVKGLCELLFPDNEPPLAVPDFNQAHCTRQMAMTCIWIHLFKKAQSENASLQWPVPSKLKVHHEFLHHLASPANTNLTMGSDYRIVLLCNAFSTNQELFSRPMAALVENILGGPKSTVPPTTPLSMAVLDSLTVHSKMSLIHSIVTHVIKLAQQKSSLPLAPALVETYSRLLVYTEIESLGIKGFITQLLPTVFKSNALGTLYLLLEMFSYRMHHLPSHYRVQLLADLHSIAQTNHAQLHLCVESTALRLITGLGNGEVQPQLSRFLSEPKTLVSAESEELNRALVLTLARALHISGASGEWCQELLTTITQCTPHAWAVHTLECFPKTLHDFFLPLQNQVPKENQQQLKKAVEEEYRNWASMNNENDIFAHFSKSGTPPLFLCLLWKMLLDTDRISSIAYKILERIAPRAFSAHLRKFCDCLVFEFSNSPGGQHVNKCVDTINDMIWKYHIVTIDRLVLCLALRTQEGSEAQVCFFIIQLLLLKATEFRSRVQEFVKENSPDHWNQSNWHEKHLAFHRKFPEEFAPEEQGATSSSSSAYHPLPVYFGNVCLRFLPVFDIVIHRYLEIPQVTKSLVILLEHLGILYKFHDRPVTYLYSTLHYYEGKLREKSHLKRRLVGAVLGHYKESLSEQYQLFLNRPIDETWIPELDYYLQLVKRFTDTMTGVNNQINQTIDWRFNEFPNAGAHSLYLTCVELMALPVGPKVVTNNLLDVIAKGYTVIPPKQLQSWINSIGVLLGALPESYWSVVQDRIIYILGQLATWDFRYSPFTMFQLQATHDGLLDNRFSFALALVHSVWHHAGPGQIASLPRFIKERLPSIVKTEAQFLFVCHLIGPFMQRYKSASELTFALYELLAQVDQHEKHLTYIDPICDLLYHIKYMFVGDSLKKELENVIRRLRPALQIRLRNIANISVDTTGAGGANVVGAGGALQGGQQQSTGFPAGAVSSSVPGSGSVVTPVGVQQILPT